MALAIVVLPLIFFDDQLGHEPQTYRRFSQGVERGSYITTDEDPASAEFVPEVVKGSK